MLVRFGAILPLVVKSRRLNNDFSFLALPMKEMGGFVGLEQGFTTWGTFAYLKKYIEG